MTDDLLGVGDRWAIVVGVNQYVDHVHYPELRVCAADAGALGTTLISAGYNPARVKLITDSTQDHPLRSTILNCIRGTAASAGPQDLILLYFSGHGDYDSVTEASYLIAKDAYRSDLQGSAISISGVRSILDQSKAAAKVIILDACHSGAAIGKSTPTMSPQFIKRVFKQARGLAVLASCQQGELSYERDDIMQSAFTHSLLRALAGHADRDGKGFVTVQDVSVFVANEVGQWATAQNRSQTPTLEYLVSGDIVMSRPRDKVGDSDRNERPNPFGALGRITDPALFYDRDQVMARIFEELRKGVNLQIVGPSRIGKSSMLMQIMHLGPKILGGEPSDYCYLNMERVEGDADFWEAFCEALSIDPPAKGWALQRRLNQGFRNGRKIVLCLDEIERMTWTGFTVGLRTQIRGMADGGTAPLKLVIATRLPLKDVFSDASTVESPLAGICRTIQLDPFDDATARSFIQERLSRTGIDFSAFQIANLLAETGGRPADLHDHAAALFHEIRSNP